MDLVCTSCHVTYVGSRKSDSKVSGVCLGPSVRHVLVLRSSARVYSQAVSCAKLVSPKTTQVWGQSGDFCCSSWNKGPQRCGQCRAAFSNSEDKRTASNGGRTGNGAIGAMALTHTEKLDDNVDHAVEGELVVDNSDTTNSKSTFTKRPANSRSGHNEETKSDRTSSKDTSTRRHANTHRRHKEKTNSNTNNSKDFSTRPNEETNSETTNSNDTSRPVNTDRRHSEETNSDTTNSKDTSRRANLHREQNEENSYLTYTTYEPSGLREESQLERKGKLQEMFLEEKTDFSGAEKDKYVALVWEAGSEIEALTPEMASEKDRMATEAEETSIVEEEQHGQEEPVLGVEISRHVSNTESQWLNQQTAIQGPIWIPRDDTAFAKFWGNLSKIQENIWLMIAVHGELAWIRVQQLLARRLRGLQEILANFPDSESDLNVREIELLAFADKLMKQSVQNEEAYTSSLKALGRAEEMVIQLKTRINELSEDLASRDALLRLLQKEAAVSSDFLQRAAQSLTDAERRILDLENQVQVGGKLLCEQREVVQGAEDRVAELTAEVSSLKALAALGRRAEYLKTQVHALEKEVKSRDSLLLEINAETKGSTEALASAVRIKQDLNAVKQRELQLTQELERANYIVKDLQRELEGNLRAKRAEQALMQTEKMLKESQTEGLQLRQGVLERDKAIYMMKDEVDAHMRILNNALLDREESHKLRLQMEHLKAELGSKEKNLKIMREEMALVYNLARQNQDNFSGTFSHHTKLPAEVSPSTVKKPKLKKEPKPKKIPQSKKKTSSKRSTRSSPE